MILTVGLVDANQQKDDELDGLNLTSVVARWLIYEMNEYGLHPTAPQHADIVLLVHSGEVDFGWHTRSVFKTLNINPNPKTRKQKPYIITGGAIDATPMLALSIADALAVGEAYNFVRDLFALIAKGGAIEDVRQYIIDYPHAIERQQIEHLQRDSQAPYLLSEPAPKIASPDEYVDWGDLQPFDAGDNVIRLTASKGCWKKCAFCATTYRQTYRINEDSERLVGQMQDLVAGGQRVALITNDAADLPFYSQVVDEGQLQFQSVTISALKRPGVLADVLRTRMKLVRFGVEGISERLRIAFGKPVSNTELLHIVGEFQKAKQNFRAFFIVGAPYEDDADYQNLYELLVQLEAVVKRGYNQFKFTKFNAQAPTPLVYGAPNLNYLKRYNKAIDRFNVESRSPYMRFMQPRGINTHIRDFAEVFTIPQKVALQYLNTENTMDLAPTLDHAKRFPHEMIQWYIPTEKRWRIWQSYKKRMGVYVPND